MPITLRWADETKTLLIAEFVGKWTLDDFSLVVDEVREMLDSVAHPVNAIAHGKSSAGIPKGSNILPHLKRLCGMRLEHIAVLPSSKITRVVLNLFLQFNENWKSRITFVDSLEEAYAVLRQPQLQ